MIKRYESYDNFMVDAAKAERYSSDSASDFTGYKTYTESVELAKDGDSALVSQAEAMLDQLADVGNGEAIQTWNPSPMGAYPVVPEYLAGHPFCMRSRCDSEDISPVNIYICTTISAKLDSTDLMRRGTALLALAMKLQQVRPVQLWLTAETHGRTDGDLIQVIPMQSNPISIAHACNAMTSNHFARHLTYAMARKLDGFNGSWGKQYIAHGRRPGAYAAWVKRELGLSAMDLYIEPGHCDDKLIKSPVAWVNEQLARYSNSEVE